MTDVQHVQSVVWNGAAVLGKWDSSGVVTLGSLKCFQSAFMVNVSYGKCELGNLAAGLSAFKNF